VEIKGSMYNLGSRSALCAELWAGTETALGARLPRKEVFQQPLILYFGLIAAMQDKQLLWTFLPFFVFPYSVLHREGKG